MNPAPPGDNHHRTAVSLLSEAPGEDRAFRLRVKGGSMTPLLRSGDHVIAVCVPPDDLHRGDLVVHQRDSELVTHRLILHEISEGWYTKGDNRAYPDPPVKAAAILGRVIAVEVESGRLDFSEPHWGVLNRALGRLGSWIAALVGTGRRLKTQTESGDLPTSSTGREGPGFHQGLVWIIRRLVAAPFRTLTWIISSYARWRYTLHRPVQ